MAVKRVEGVEDAKFSYAGGEGWVTFDTTMTSPEEFLGELSRLTAFRGMVREFPEREGEDHDHSDPNHEHTGDESHN